MFQDLVLIVDRTVPSVGWAVRRHVGEKAGKDFAKWLSSPERGRFLIIDPSKSTSAEMWVNAADEADLIEELVRRTRDQLSRDRDAQMPIYMLHNVAPPERAKIERAIYEIRAIVKTGKPPADPWKAQSTS